MLPISYECARKKLGAVEQLHLLDHWKDLSDLAQAELLQEINELDLTLFQQQRAALSDKVSIPWSYAPFTIPLKKTYQLDFQQSLAQLKQKVRVACFLIAGGQGSRLQWQRPKGTYPISVIHQKSLFQLFAEKIAIVSHLLGSAIPIAIMTSQANNSEARAFFQQHNYFGLDPAQIDFCMQSTSPLLTMEGNLFLETSTQIAKGPCGNGEALRVLYRSGIWHKWQQLGIELVEFLPIDNPLAMPYDWEMLLLHSKQQAEVSLQCIARIDPYEKVGVLVTKQQQINVIEYSEMPLNEQVAQDQFGQLKHAYANIGVFVFTMDFIYRSAMFYTNQMSWHIATKTAAYWHKGITQISSKPCFLKFEQFIFDLLLFSQKSIGIICIRESSFAPLKNAEGTDSPTTVKAALQAADRRAFAVSSGIYPACHRLFELAPHFHYPTEDLKNKWQGKPLPLESYIQ